MATPLLDQLIEALRVLPGVGQKTAQRMAFHLLQRDREGGVHMAEVVTQAMQHIKNCRECRNLTETDICHVCSNHARDRSLLCVVESPSDQMVLETATDYRGLYFVLHGRLSPIDGLGPAELGMGQLNQLLETRNVREMIIATNATLEGEATAHYLTQMARRHGAKPSRIAHGVPLGGELEYLDRGTLAHAFGNRSEVHEETRSSP